MTFSTDRAAGVLLGTACGDALGAGYEFGPALPDNTVVAMKGSGVFAPGEWTDDTSMAVAIAEATAQGHDVRTSAGLSAVADGFQRWYRSDPKDVGLQTRAVLGATDADSGDLGAAMTAQAADFFVRRPQESAGNGGLMRTAPVALAYLNDPAGLVEAARRVSDLTHGDPVSGEACVLWCLAIRHAVLEGNFEGLREGLRYLPHDRAEYWAALLDEAEAKRPRDFDHNGWVVQALQAAWSAIVNTPVPRNDPANGSFPAQHLRLALEAAVRGGNDTDTVAAIAGGLLGARWGASAVPGQWRRAIHGWPGYRGRDLIRLAVHTARRAAAKEPDDGEGWPSGATVDYASWHPHEHVVPHPRDPKVLLSTVLGLRTRPAGVNAVVSLCRLGASEIPAAGIDPRDHVEVWLVDSGAGENPHLEYVIDDAARTVAALRAEGKTVLLHCVAAHSRTPTIAARYSVITTGIAPQTALDEIVAALPSSSVHPGLRAGLYHLGGGPR